MRKRLVLSTALATALATALLPWTAVADHHGERHLEELAPYLMEQEEEVILARSGGPSTVSADARVLVLTTDGFVEAVSGDSEFTCLVLRSWGAPAAIRGRLRGSFFDPKIRAPMCFNGPGSESVLPEKLMTTDLVLAQHSHAEIRDRIDRARAEGELPLPAPSAMGYMMSSAQHLNDRIGAWKPHVMLYIPYATNELWGGNAIQGDHPQVLFGEGGPGAVVTIPVPEFVDPVREGEAEGSS